MSRFSPRSHQTGLLGPALIVLLLLGIAGESGGQPNEQRPMVSLIATGGTISNRPGGRLTADQLVEAIPALDQHVVADVEQFDNVSSSMLTLDQWLELSRRINRLFRERPGLEGVVVTTGTDTLEETAYFLHLTVRSVRPVVVVGSMRPPQSLGYDGTANLLQGFRVAADPASRGRGVLVVLNGEINSARDVSKTNAQRLQTFDAGAYGFLGVVDPDRVVYYRRTERRHTSSSEFDVTSVTRLPRVDVVMTYQGAPGDTITNATEAGAMGLVVAGAGTGATSPGQRDAIQTISEAGIPVVIASRTGGGRVPVHPQTQDPGSESWASVAAHIGGEDLSPVKARILLMLALTVTTDPQEIQRMFLEY